MHHRPSPSSRPPLVRDVDLSDQQRAWMPATAWDAFGQWPCASKVELADRLEFLTHAGGWDWRSVATAARAYPGWRVELQGDGFLTIAPPQGQDPTDATATASGARTPPTVEAPSDQKSTRWQTSKPALAWFAEAITGAWICLVVALNRALRHDDTLVVGTLLLAASMILLMRLDARREYHRGWADARLHAATLPHPVQRPRQPPDQPRTLHEPWHRSTLFVAATRTTGQAARRPSDEADET
ncbi:hypothetical protein [Cellulomonas biazotea]|uniref:Uncharacterized protein n=1 Tax=Cellulomonas biazotea TaxID=1709 RepID=A0A402DNI9_9CELL|nr:hypothetical protein [Cellulomonas biazotea]GCE75641.1 hypothetical protein CBZ_06970 [Cellulomonas biazotea]